MSFIKLVLNKAIVPTYQKYGLESFFLEQQTSVVHILFLILDVVKNVSVSRCLVNSI